MLNSCLVGFFVEEKAMKTDAFTVALQAALLKQRKSLALLPLVAVIFYDVSGGPFGVEVSY